MATAAAGTVDAFSPTTNSYDPQGTYATAPSGTAGYALGRIKDSSENVWCFSNGGAVARWNQTTATWTSVATRSVFDIDRPFAYDSSRNRVLRCSNGGALYDLSSNASETKPGFSGAAAASVSGPGSMWYCPSRDSFIYTNWQKGFYEINASTFSVGSLTIAGNLGVSVVGDGTSHLYGRFGYAPELTGFYYINSVTDNVWFFKSN